MVGVLEPLFRTAGHTVRTQHGVMASAGQRRGDVEIRSPPPANPDDELWTLDIWFHASVCVCLLLQYLLQSCSRGGRGIVVDIDDEPRPNPDETSGLGGVHRKVKIKPSV